MGLIGWIFYIKFNKKCTKIKRDQFFFLSFVKNIKSNADSKKFALYLLSWRSFLKYGYIFIYFKKRYQKI